MKKKKFSVTKLLSETENKERRNLCLLIFENFKILLFKF